MKEQLFSIKEAIGEGWKYTKDNLGFLIGYQVIIFLVSLFSVGGNRGLIGALLTTLIWILVSSFSFGFYKSGLLIVDGEKPVFSLLFRAFKNLPTFASWILAHILFGIMITVGVALFIIPGLYIMARFGLYPFFIVDKNLGVIDSLKEASKATEGIRWHMFLLYASIFVIYLAGFLAFGVGILIAAPVGLLAMATVYRKLVEQVVLPDVLDQ